jgi:hypothetical protein
MDNLLSQTLVSIFLCFRVAHCEFNFFTYQVYLDFAPIAQMTLAPSDPERN